MSFKFGAIALLASIAALPAQAATTIASAFTRVSPAENITAPFTLPTGTSSIGTYTGAVEILVRGTGYSLGSRINDAFYFTDDGSLAAGYYHLGLGTAALPLAAFTPSRGIENYISFIDGVGAVTAGSVPAYAASNIYRFVVDLGAQTTALSFGVLDGNYADNGGQYNISVWQLAPGASAVPEASTWMMLIVGFAAVGFAARRRKSLMMSAR